MPDVVSADVQRQNIHEKFGSCVVGLNLGNNLVASLDLAFAFRSLVAVVALAKSHSLVDLALLALVYSLLTCLDEVIKAKVMSIRNFVTATPKTAFVGGCLTRLGCPPASVGSIVSGRSPRACCLTIAIEAGVILRVLVPTA